MTSLPVGRSRRPGWLLGVLVLALAWIAAGPARGEVRVEIALEPAAIAAGETAVLTVTVTGASRVDEGPVVPETPGLTFRSAGRSSNISIVNGRMTQSIAWNFLLLGEKPGRYTIGPVEVREKGRAYRSGTAGLAVAEAGTVPSGSGGPGGRTPGTGAPRTGQAGGGGGSVPAPGDVDPAQGEVFARASVDRDRVLVGEQVTLRFQVWVPLDLPVLDSQIANLPATEGFWREDLLPQRSSSTAVRGRPYQVTEFVSALFPTRDGRLTIGEGVVDLVVQDRRGGRRSIDPFGFFGSYQERRVQLRSKALAVRVDPLPEPRPADFTGGVGTFRLRGALERGETGQNEPLTLVLTVEGTGNVSTVGDPGLPEMPGVRTYASGSEVQSGHDGDQLRGTKTFRFVLVPESTGRKEVPPVRLSVFDPRERRFVRLETPAFPYIVTAATGPSGGGEVARTGRDLRSNRSGGRLTRIGAAEPWRSAGFWAWQAVPLLLLAAGVGLRSYRRRRDSDWGGFLSRGAPGRLGRELASIGSAAEGEVEAGYARLDAALDRYFTDRFQLPARALTREDLAAELGRRGVSEDGITAARALLDQCDFARFAPAVRTVSMLRQLLEEARSIPSHLEPQSRPSRRRGGRGGAGRGARRGPTGTALIALLVATGLAAGELVAPLAGAPATGAAAEAASAATANASGRSGALASLARGHDAYSGGDYVGAVEAYRSVLEAGYESPELYLALGNASYRVGRLGWAVYWFERGLRLDPGDPDLRTNLESVRAETRDRAVGEDASQFLGSLTALQDRLRPSAAARGFTWAWVLFAAWLALRVGLSGAAPGPGAAGALRWTGVILGACLAVAAAGVLVKLAQASGAATAVVVADELPVRSNPDPDATVEFTLHAGTRARIGRSSLGFREVLYSEKLHGWGSADGLAGLSDREVLEAVRRRP